MIHVCFGLYDKTGRYSKFTGTAVLSIFENTNSEVTVHILHDNTLSDDNRDKFSCLAERYGQLVNFYNVEELCAKKIAAIRKVMPAVSKSVYSIATFYRFFIPQIFSSDIEKVIYLDSDTIVNLDINELWQLEINDYPIGVVPIISQSTNSREITEWVNCNFKICRDELVKFDNYFNAGILLLNLKIFREEENTLMNAMNFISEQPRYEFFDQDVLNYCFAVQALKLSNKFNRYVRFARSDKEFLDRKIYHYVGQNSIWSFSLDMSDPFNRLWMKYFIKTPWFDVDTIGRIYEGVQRLHVELKQAMVQLSALMSGKTRAFFVLPEDIEMIKIFFAIRADEEVILAEGQQSLQELIDAMKRSQGKKVFFIIVANFPFKVLTEAGFINGRDFMNGIEFLSEMNGVPLDSHNLLKSM